MKRLRSYYWTSEGEGFVEAPSRSERTYPQTVLRPKIGDAIKIPARIGRSNVVLAMDDVMQSPAPRQFEQPDMYQVIHHELVPAIEQLRQEIALLHEAISDLAATEPSAQDVSDADARQLVAQFLQDADGEVYPSDIAERLRLDYDQVERALEQLKNEGCAAPAIE